MATETQAEQRTRLIALLASGVRSDSHDGSATTFNSPKEIELQLIKLDRALGYRKSRSRFNTPAMGRR